MNDYGAVVERYWQRKSKVPGENLFQVPLCSPQIPHVQAW